MCLAGTTHTDAIGRRRKVRAVEIVASCDRIQLQVVPLESRTRGAVDASWPPYRGVAAVGPQAHDRVVTDRIRMQDAVDQREVVQVQAARQDAGSNRQQRPALRWLSTNIRSCDAPLDRPEPEELIRVARAREIYHTGDVIDC